MVKEHQIPADGNSPLTQYVDFLISVHENLARLLDRDAEAVRILEADPAQKKTGRVHLKRRIWTRRDVRHVNRKKGSSNPGFLPVRRAMRFLNRLQPRQGDSRHDYRFRSAINEARQDGTAGVLCEKLEKIRSLYEELISTARSLAYGEGERFDFDSIWHRLSPLTCELMNWTRESESFGDNDIENTRGAEKPTTKLTKEKRATVNQRMAETLMDNKEAIGWNSTQWAKYLKCGKSTVVETSTWKAFGSARQGTKAERMKDRRRKPKANDSRRD